ncbi:MAG TPA: tetratricopeptide repeat protein [Pirellulales bacterium]|nr:tetratricopeptide repeat protein [Pirellulales bacterium]
MTTDSKVEVQKRLKATAPRPATAAKARSGKRWVLNFRLLGVTAAVLAVVAPALYFWHAYQVERNASALLALAGRHEERDEWMEAAEELHRYLQLRPDDLEAIVRRAEDFYRGAKAPLQKVRAVQLYALAIALAPDRDDLQRRQMSLRLETGDYRAAVEQARKLLQNTPDDPEALRVRALGQYHQWRSRKVEPPQTIIDAFQAAIAKNPNDSELATTLAVFYRVDVRPSKALGKAELEQKADEAMDALVARSEQKADAFLNRYLYRLQFNLPEADADLDQAVQADEPKKTLGVWLAAGQRALSARDYQRAVEHFRDAVELEPADRRGHLGLGNAYSAQGKDEPAVGAWQEGLAKTEPNDIELQLLIAAAEVRLERWKQAETDLARLERQLAPLTGPQQAELQGTIHLLRADAAIGNKRYAQALASLKQSLKLRQAGAESLRRAASIAQVETRMAQCYTALGQADQAALAYQRAADLLPRDAGPRLLAAVAWEAAGRFDEAVRQYDETLTLKGIASGVRVALANAEYLRQLTTPSAQRNWERLSAELALAKADFAEREVAEPALLTLVDSEYQALNGLVDQVVERVQGIEEALLENKDLTRRLAFDYERWERSNDADRLLERFRTVAKDPLDYRLLAAEVQFRRNRHDEAFRLLTDVLPTTSGAARRDVQFRLAVMYLADGKVEQARPLLASLAADDKDDPRPLQFLAELALQSGNIEDAVTCNRDLEAREGPDGTNWRYYRAQQLLAQAGKLAKDDSAAAKKLLQQAVELQQQVETLRPGWAPGYLLKARLLEAGLVRDEATAIQAYTQAIRLGLKSVPIYDALILLLYRQNRIAEADGYLSQLRDANLLPQEMTPLAMAIDIRRGNVSSAIAMAREQIAKEPNDAVRHLRLGMLLAGEANQRDASAKAEAADEAKLAEAEVELKRARDLAADDSRNWAALLSFYISSRQTEAAAKLLDEVQQTESLTGDVKAFFLAQGYAALGDHEQAKSHYLEAIEAAPERAAVHKQAGTYFYTRDRQLAEKCLRRAHDIDPNDHVTTRLLANLLTSTGETQENLDTAWKLLGEGQADELIEPADKRLHAILLLKRGGTDYRQHAQQLLEALAGDSKRAAPIDRLLLARLYEAQGKMAEAREQLKLLVNIERPAPEHLAAYIDNLLRSGRSAEAAGRLDELARTEPETSSLRTLSLRVRWLKDQDRATDIGPRIESFLEDRLAALPEKPKQAKAVVAAAELYAAVGMAEAAEQTYRRAIEIDASATRDLVSWLNKQGRTSEAIRLCLEMAQNDSSPLPAMLLSNVLAVGRPTEEDERAAGPVFERALAEHADQPELLFSMSIKYLMDGRNDEAIDLLRKTLKLRPRHLPAMNNLAFILSLKPDGREEAADLMDRAIAIAGMNPELLDSKGWVLMQQHKLAEALDAFQEALSSAPGDARYHFHLALTYQLQGKLEAARKSLAQARQGGLASAVLPPDEKSALTRLETALQ